MPKDSPGLESLMYTLSSLSECADLLSRPLARDHYLSYDGDRMNQVRISDIITGVGTEQANALKQRVDVATDALGSFIDEICCRNLEELGFPVILSLLNQEIESDHDGVPHDVAETKLCSLVGRILVRCEQVCVDPHGVENFCIATLEDSEQLVYHKYKLLKAFKSGLEELSNARECGKSDLLETLRQDKYFSLVKLRGKFIETYTRTLSRTLIARLKNDSGIAHTALLPEIICAQVHVAKISKDWGSLEAPILDIIGFLELSSGSRPDLMQALCTLLLAHESVLPIFIAEIENRKRLVLTFRRSLSFDLSQDLRTVVSHIITLIDEVDHSFRPA